MKKPRVLLLDIETAPNLVYTWALYQQDIAINQIVHRGYMLCWAAKWLGEKRIYSDALINYTEYAPNFHRREGSISRTIHEMMNEADIVVAHNGNSFDLRWLNTVFLRNGLQPPSPFKAIDTRLESKRHFRFVSNKLDYLCQEMSLGKKLKNEGFELWINCMVGKKQSWTKMVRYNKHDVKLLEELYLTIRPFIRKHPNMALYVDDEHLQCPNCRGSHFRREGHAYLSAGKYHRYQCKDCGKWVRGSKNLLTKEKRKNLGKQV